MLARRTFDLVRPGLEIEFGVPAAVIDAKQRLLFATFRCCQKDQSIHPLTSSVTPPPPPPHTQLLVAVWLCAEDLYGGHGDHPDLDLSRLQSHHRANIRYWCHASNRPFTKGESIKHYADFLNFPLKNPAAPTECAFSLAFASMDLPASRQMWTCTAACPS